MTPAELRQLRIRKGISLLELADALHTSRPLLRMIETERMILSPQQLQQYEAALLNYIASRR